MIKVGEAIHAKVACLPSLRNVPSIGEFRREHQTPKFEVDQNTGTKNIAHQNVRPIYPFRSPPQKIPGRCQKSAISPQLRQ